jgi:hypothetical protein
MVLKVIAVGTITDKGKSSAGVSLKDWLEAFDPFFSGKTPDKKEKRAFRMTFG